TGLAFVVRRAAPLAWIGWLWFLIAIAPESSVVPISDVMVEHRTYLPMVGLCLGAAALLARFVAEDRRRQIVPAMIVIALITITHARNRAWRDPATLWADVVRKSPAKPRGYNNLAMALEANGHEAAAESTYRRAIAIQPDYVYARVNLGRLYGIHGRYREAVTVLEEARRIEPDRPDVLTNLGTAWWGLGDTTRASEMYRHAIESWPSEHQARDDLARMRGLPAP